MDARVVLGFKLMVEYGPEYSQLVYDSIVFAGATRTVTG